MADSLPSVTLTGGQTFRLPAEPTLEQDLAVMDILNSAGLLISGKLDVDIPLDVHVEQATLKLISSGKAIPLLATLLIEEGQDDWDETRALQAMQLFRREKNPVIKAQLLENLAPSVAGFFVNAIRSSGISLSSLKVSPSLMDQLNVPSPQAT